MLPFIPFCISSCPLFHYISTLHSFFTSPFLTPLSFFLSFPLCSLSSLFFLSLYLPLYSSQHLFVFIYLQAVKSVIYLSASSRQSYRLHPHSVQAVVAYVWLRSGTRGRQVAADPILQVAQNILYKTRTGRVTKQTYVTSK